MPGLYELQLPDACISSSDAANCWITLRGAANMAVTNIRIKTVANLNSLLGTLLALIAARPSSADIADAVWDEILTEALHNTANSAGRRLRNAEARYCRFNPSVHAPSASS
jgi:hypothetical protein